MREELNEAADIIAEKERGEEMGPVPMEEEQEPVYYNPVYSQMPPSAPTALNKTIFNVIPVPEPKVEPTIPNLQQDVHYEAMPSQPPPNFETKHNQSFEDSPPFNAVF